MHKFWNRALALLVVLGFGVGVVACDDQDDDDDGSSNTTQNDKDMGGW